MCHLESPPTTDVALHSLTIMRNIYSCLALAFIAASSVSAQTFRLETTPRQLTVIPGEVATFHVEVTPIDGYRATVNLHVLLPTLGGGAIFTSPERLNTPYSGGAKFSITPTVPQTGSHTLIVEGWNGSLFVRDTVVLVVQHTQMLRGWASYNTGNSPLPNNIISGIEFANDGAAWISTYGGIARFDGSSWQVFGVNGSNADTSYGGLQVMQSARDSTGALYFLGPHWIYRYDNGTWTTTWTYENVTPMGNGSDIAVSPDGTVYALYRDGVLRYDGRKWEPMVNAPGGNKIAINREGAIDVIRTDDLYRFDGRFWSEFRTQELGISDRLNDVTFDRSGNRWYITGRSLMRETDSSRPAYITNNDFVEHYSEMYTALAFAGDGSMWAGGAGRNDINYVRGSGIARSRDGRWDIYRVTNSGMPSNHVTYLRVDRFDRVWIGTWGAGLAVFDPRVAAGVDDDAVAAGAVVAYPNPAADRCALQLALAPHAAVDITLIDQLGRTLLATDAVASASGACNVTLDVADIPEGSYYVKITGKDGVRATRLSIVR